MSDKLGQLLSSNYFVLLVLRMFFKTITLVEFLEKRIVANIFLKII